MPFSPNREERLDQLRQKAIESTKEDKRSTEMKKEDHIGSSSSGGSLNNQENMVAKNTLNKNYVYDCNHMRKRVLDEIN